MSRQIINFVTSDKIFVHYVKKTLSKLVIKKYQIFYENLLTIERKGDIINKHSEIEHIAEWSSPVARRAHNPKVVGSNPASATNTLHKVHKCLVCGLYVIYLNI